MTTPAQVVALLVQELLAFHDCADGNIENGNGHFRLVCISDSDKQRLALRSVLRDSAALIISLSESVAAEREACAKLALDRASVWRLNSVEIEASRTRALECEKIARNIRARKG